MPGQPSPNLSLSSLPIPSYRTIRLLPFSPSGSPSDYSGPNPHQMLTQNCNNTVQKPSALHFSCDSSKRWLACSLLHFPCATEMLQIIFEFPASFETIHFYPKEFSSFTRLLMLSSQQRLDPAKIRSWTSLLLFPSHQQNCSLSFMCCCTSSRHSSLLLQCNPDVLRLVNLLTFSSKTNLQRRLFGSIAPQPSATNT